MLRGNKSKKFSDCNSGSEEPPSSLLLVKAGLILFNGMVIVVISAMIIRLFFTTAFVNQTAEAEVLQESSEPTTARVYLGPEQYTRVETSNYEEVTEKRELKEVKSYGNGTCVPYARYRTGIKLYGNAATFLKRAEKEGYATGTEPVVGGMIITDESTGHVAAVEKIKENKIYISEQNYKGLYIVSSRWLDKNDEKVVGYIY